MAKANVLDYSGWRPDPRQLVAAGIVGVSRYLTTSTSAFGQAKLIRQAEYDALLATGIAVVLNFENNKLDFLGGYDRGFTNGRAGRALARALGHPDDRPIIESIDTSIEPEELETALAYHRGFNDGADTGHGPQGCYGTALLLEHLRSRGWVSVMWQPVAAWGWTGNGTRHKHAHMYQLGSKSYPQWAPLDYDENELNVSRYGATIDYGQHPKPVQPKPPPASATVPGFLGNLL